MLQIGSRERTLAPGPHIVWRSLVEPSAPGTRPWLELLSDEVQPAVLDADEPSLVVWSSLWPDRSEDIVRLNLRAKGQGTALRWTALTPGEVPNPSRAGHVRFRLNYLLFDKLLTSYGQ